MGPACVSVATAATLPYPLAVPPADGPAATPMLCQDILGRK